MRIFGLLLLIFIFASGGCNNATTNHQEAGVQLSNNGHWEEAITAFDEAISANPRDSLAYYTAPTPTATLVNTVWPSRIMMRSWALIREMLWPTTAALTPISI